MSGIGYLPAVDIWQGAYWALWTSVFVHLRFWHLAFNLYWLWILGNAIEQYAGRLRWILLFLLSAGVSSAAELAASGDTGVGASGVVYASFGFVLTTRRGFPKLDELVTRFTVTALAAWLLLGILLTHFDLVRFGNAAHAAGLAVGVLLGLASSAGRGKKWYRLAMAALCATSLVPLFWAPWSVDWMDLQAYRAHSDGRYLDAVGWYTAILEHQPRNAWALYTRGVLFQDLGMEREAQRDIGMAIHLDPDIAVPAGSERPVP